MRLCNNFLQVASCYLLFAGNVTEIPTQESLKNEVFYNFKIWRIIKVPNVSDIYLTITFVLDRLFMEIPMSLPKYLYFLDSAQ